MAGNRKKTNTNKPTTAMKAPFALPVKSPSKGGVVNQTIININAPVTINFSGAETLKSTLPKEGNKLFDFLGKIFSNTISKVIADVIVTYLITNGILSTIAF